jgi:hypothetical protein
MAIGANRRHRAATIHANESQRPAVDGDCLFHSAMAAAFAITSIE